jgi:hypothetical protein
MDASKLRKFWSLILDASPDGLTEVPEAVFVSQLSTYINDYIDLNSTERKALRAYLQAKRHLILDVLFA